MRQFYVYIMTNRSGTLYTGMTNDLRRRVDQHRRGEGSRFTAKYRIGRLIYYQACSDVKSAIAREKEIKGWRRSKKIALIESMNPEWRDLSEDW
jgi:putative endonuclease